MNDAGMLMWLAARPRQDGAESDKAKTLSPTTISKTGFLGWLGQLLDRIDRRFDTQL